MLTVLFRPAMDLMMIRPSDIQSPLNYYRFFTYSFCMWGISTWFFSSISLFILGRIIEARYSQKFIWLVTIISALLGGVSFSLIDYFFSDDNVPMISAHMIVTGYFIVSLIIAFQDWKNISIPVKIYLGLILVDYLFINKSSLGFSIATLLVMVVIFFYTLAFKNREKLDDYEEEKTFLSKT